jgi:hypothetical protein
MKGFILVLGINMITKEEFVLLISKHKEWDNRIDEVSKSLNCFILDADWVSYTAELFDNTIKLLFTDEGADWIFWWLWEKDGNPELLAYDSEDNIIPSETIDDLWELVKNYRK